MRCIVPGCDRAAIVGSLGAATDVAKFCARHLAASEAWLAEENRLDAAEEARRRALDGGVVWDERPSFADELAAIGWDDPDDVAEAAA